MNGLIESVKPLGSEGVLLATCGTSQLTARVEPQTQAKPQVALGLVLDMNHVHLFDRDTQKSY